MSKSTQERYPLGDSRLTKEALGDRVRDLLGVEKQTEFVERTGFSYATLRSVLGAKHELARDSLLELANALGTTVEYLATGQHPFSSDSSAATDSNIELGLLSFGELLEDVNIQTSKIPKTRAFNRIKLTLTDSWFQSNRLEPEHTKLVLNQTDTMDPTIKNGDFMVVDTTPGLPVMEGIYLLLMGHSLTLRRMTASPSGLNAMPDNSRYTPFKVALDENGMLTGDNMTTIGRVFWVLQTLQP